jgi:hypothetical protein
MKANSIHLTKAVLVLALAFAFAAPGVLSAQGEGEDTGSLTLQSVKDRLQESRKHLDEAKKRGKAGDAAGMETALQNYERGMQGLDRALSRGQIAGSVYEREEALSRVEAATRKHGEVLAGLLESGKIPEQARSHVEHAMQVSQKGRQTALANLQQTRSQRREQEAAQHRQGSGAPGVYGRPTGAGSPPSGVGGPSSGGGGTSGTPAAGRGNAGRGPR